MEEMPSLNVFTIAEANQLLPKLTEWIFELRSIRDDLARQEVEIDAEELISGSGTESKSSDMHLKVDSYNHSVARFYGVIDKIQQRGCFLKDPSLGLIDFYGQYQGKVVFYCWKLGEKEILYWHEVGFGYKDRRPLTPSEDEGLTGT